MDHQQLLEKYRAQSLAFIDAAKHIPAAAMYISKDGEWSASFVIHHIADAELQFGVRYANALAEENPAIVPFDEEKFPDALKYQNRSVEISIQALSSLHELNYEILKSASDSDWVRTSIHPQRGSVTLFDIVSLSANHIEGHIAQLKSAAI